ncbi:hypothetical protein ACFL7M_00850 [Thermodesulfobacteriota bacterium]
MPSKEQVESKLKEAELYRSQGLYEQSKQIYMDLLESIKKDSSLSQDKPLLNRINDKMKTVDDQMTEVDEATDTPALAEDVQNLISNLFSFSKNKQVAAIEGAVALAKFGQYEKAIAEFQRLINEGNFPIMAARNMLRCQLTLSSPDTAVAQFKKWSSHNLFSQAELDHLREFLENLLEKEGIKADLPAITVKDPKKRKKEDRMEDVFEISSLCIRLESGPRKGQEHDFDVTFQVGNTVSLIIKAGDQVLADSFKPGIKLSRIQCFSPVSLFNCRGFVSEKSKIMAGPKKGDYTLDITIDGE